ncbi:hypothetical protein ID866_7412 [Astraeus odoratus]|nr:hypothetical protein ID866_7412 [Astraeus odoratus]
MDLEPSNGPDNEDGDGDGDGMEEEAEGDGEGEGEGTAGDKDPERDILEAVDAAEERTGTSRTVGVGKSSGSVGGMLAREAIPRYGGRGGMAPRTVVPAGGIGVKGE